MKNNKILVVGGEYFQPFPRDKEPDPITEDPRNIELYDPVTNTSKIVGKLNAYRDTRPMLFQINDNEVLIAGGGKHHDNLAKLETPGEIELFNLKTGKSEVIGRFDPPKSNISGLLLPNKKAVFWGGTNQLDQYDVITRRTVQLVNPEAKEVKTIDKLPFRWTYWPNNDYGVTIGHKVYFFSGNNSMWVFDTQKFLSDLNNGEQ